MIVVGQTKITERIMGYRLIHNVIVSFSMAQILTSCTGKFGYYDLIDKTKVPDWFTLFDLIMIGFAAFAVGIMLGHMLGKGGR